MNIAPLALALGLVLANGFFVAIEFALVKIRPTQLDAMVEDRRPGAHHAMAMRRRLDAYLSACQVGITLASLGLGWVGEPAFAHLLEPWVASLSAALGQVPAASPFAPLAPPLQSVVRFVPTASAFVFITVLHIVFGEQVPKMLGIQRPEGTSLALAAPMRGFYVLFFPLIWLLNESTRKVGRLVGLKASGSEHEALGEDELRAVLASSAEAGVIGLERAELLERTLAMVEKTARQILVPRNQMHYLDLEDSLDKNIAAARGSGHTWLPVCRGSPDRVEGILNVKDLFFVLARGDLRSIGQVQRPVLFVPENVTLEQLLTEFRRRRNQMAVVVDEHGGTSGIVTLSDVVAELVGEVAELGRRVEPVRALPGGRLELPGTAQIDDLEHTLQISFDVEPGEISTIAGYLMTKLGRIPKPGDAWTLEGYSIRVVQTDGPRVVTVQIEPKTGPNPPRSG